MATPPVTAAVAPDHLLDYFRALARQTRLPLIVQDASSYVGQSIPPSVCIQLLDEFGADRILFKPEANPIGPNLSALRDATGGRARIFEGSGGLALVDSYRRGIVGTIPGMEFLPGVVALWRALQRGDESAIYAAVPAARRPGPTPASGGIGWLSGHREVLCCGSEACSVPRCGAVLTDGSWTKRPESSCTGCWNVWTPPFR
jgi:hypothetical protein